VEELIVPGAIGAVIGFVALAIGWSVRSTRLRREAFARYAQAWGMKFDPTPRAVDRLPFERLPLFGLGRSHDAINRIHGELEGLALEAFDYWYVTGSGRSRTTHRQTVVGVQGPLGLPEFTLCPEGVIAKLAAALGAQDIDFTTSPEFSGLYMLRGPQEDAVRRCFGQGARDYFERHPGFTVEGNGDALVVYRPDRSVKVEDLRAALHQALEIARQLAPDATRAQSAKT
jgi:hypothetical protein